MHVQASTTLALPIDAAWQRLADLSALSQWAPDVAGSPAESLRPGATRWARLYDPVYGKDVLIERITDVNPRRYTFTYDIEDGIGPLRAIRTTWTLDVAGPRTRVTVASDLTLGGLAKVLPALVRRRWQRQLHDLANGFARWADGTEGDLEVLPATRSDAQASAPQARPSKPKGQAIKRGGKAAVARLVVKPEVAGKGRSTATAQAKPKRKTTA